MSTQLTPQQQKHRDTYIRFKATIARTGADIGMELLDAPTALHLDRCFRNISGWNMLEPMRDSLALAARRLCIAQQAHDPSGEDAQANIYLDQFDRCCANLDVVLEFEKARHNLQMAQLIAAKLPKENGMEIARDNARRAFIEAQKKFEKVTGIKTAG
jgi:hypothetical protein